LPGTPEGLVVQTTNNAGIISESRSIYVAASRQSVFDAFTTLGGEQGWYMDWGWRLRGAADWLLGGPGLRRTRPSGDVKEGDQVDFWRVESITQGQSLLLRAEMKLPGAAWLEFTATTFDGTCALLTQTSYFAPKGLAGVIYWYVLLPIHKSVFNGLIRRISTIATGESHRRSSTS
jgi:hypothetical protein